MSAGGRLTVLVTGASGLVGGEVTARLAQAGHRVVALLHGNRRLVRNDGRQLQAAAEVLQVCTGDVTRPGLGIPAGRGRSPLSGVDIVVHCAAVTQFGLRPEVYRAVNLLGTENVRAAVRQAQVPLVHVSTAYVCGEREGHIREDDLDTGQRFANPYEEAKFAAEARVREAAAEGLPAVVVRPSIVVGDERTGRVRDFKGMYPLLKLATDGRVRSIPGHYDAALDLVPVDYVADVIVEAVSRLDEVEGATLHAVGGPLTVLAFAEVLAEYPSLRVPRFVPPTGFNVAALPTTEQAYHRKVVTLYESYFRRRTRFDDSRTASFIRRPRCTGDRRYLRRLLDHCLKVGYLGTPVPGAVAAGGTPGGRAGR